MSQPKKQKKAEDNHPEIGTQGPIMMLMRMIQPKLSNKQTSSQLSLTYPSPPSFFFHKATVEQFQVVANFSWSESGCPNVSPQPRSIPVVLCLQ